MNGTLECPICTQPRHFLYVWQDFKVYHCNTCQTDSLANLPTASELEKFYQRASAKKMVAWQRCLQRVERAFEGYLRGYRRFSALEKPSTFLDLGGGVGYYSRAALNHQIEVCLMDWADDALEFARSQLNISNTVQGNIQQCSEYLEHNSFDFVLSRHSIEHMLNPQELIHNICKVLRPGGLLQIETPNASSKEQIAHPGIMACNYKILKQDNPSQAAFSRLETTLKKSMSGVNPPKHLWGFTAKGLKLLLEQNGFEVLSIERAISGHSVYDPLYYERHSLLTRKGAGVPYYFWERLVSLAFTNSGTNLVMLARYCKPKKKHSH